MSSFRKDTFLGYESLNFLNQGTNRKYHLSEIHSLVEGFLGNITQDERKRKSGRVKCVSNVKDLTLLL